MNQWRRTWRMNAGGWMAAVVASLFALGCAVEPRAAMVVPRECADVRVAAGAVAPATVEPAAVESIGITVADLDRSRAFYVGVLGFVAGEEIELSGDAFERLTGVFGALARRVTLSLGAERITLTQFVAPEGRPMPADSRSNDLWFQHIAIVVSDMDRAYAHLRAHGVRHQSSGPQTLPESIPAAAGISAFYFKDPDGHVLEVIHFPEGKGDARWHVPGDRLFLGIDHTAIATADTAASIAFYERVLGMRVAGTSENFGVEQEHLNNVFGARLRITALRGASGPGVELLEYLSPSDGREMPRDTRSNDLWSWQIAMGVGDLGEVESRIRAGRGRWVSAGVVGAGEEAGMAFRDPDGHAVVVGKALVRE